MTQLTPNFTLDELTRSTAADRLGLDNTPNAAQLANLRELAEKLQAMRDALGKPLRITSGFRNARVNRAVGGGSKSQHLHGRAADISVFEHDRETMIRAALAAGFKGIGLGRGFLHVDTRPTERVAVWSYQAGAVEVWKDALGSDPIGAVRRMAG